MISSPFEGHRNLTLLFLIDHLGFSDRKNTFEYSYTQVLDHPTFNRFR